jgi:hypothetical protein
MPLIDAHETEAESQRPFAWEAELIARADADIVAVTRWLTQPGSGPTARRRLAGLWSSIERLRQYPCQLSGRQAQRGPGTSLQWRGYRAYFRVCPDTGRNDTAGDILILRVFGPGQSRGHLLTACSPPSEP